MANTSILLMAVTSVISGGSAFLKGGDSFNNFYSISALEQYTVSSTNMKAFIDVMIEEDLEVMSTDVGNQKEAIRFNLETAAIFIDSGINTTQTAHNIVYEKKTGTLFMWMYSFRNVNSKNYVVESISCNVKLTLNDPFTLVQHTSNGFFGKRQWSEKISIPAGLTKETISNAVAIGLSPFLLGKSMTPDGIVQDLKDASKFGNEFSVSANNDATTGESWISVDGSFTRAAENKYNWEF